MFFRITLWRVTEYILFFLKFSSKQSGFSNLISLLTFWSFRNKILSNFLWISVFKLKPWVKQFKSNCFLLNEQKSLPNWNQNFWNASNIVFSNYFFNLLNFNTLFKSTLILWWNTCEIKFRIPTLWKWENKLKPFLNLVQINFWRIFFKVLESKGC